jgi:hypothetical protein
MERAKAKGPWSWRCRRRSSVRERVAFVIVFASLLFTSGAAADARPWEMRRARVNRPFAELRAFVVLAVSRGAASGGVALCGFVIGGAFAVYLAVYTVTSWIQIDLINSSADRLLMHVVAPG